jgi:hypothetical protein
MQRLAGKGITRRPMGWTDFWPHYAQHAVYRSGHQARSRDRLSKAVTALWKAQRANLKNFRTWNGKSQVVAGKAAEIGPDVSAWLLQ